MLRVLPASLLPEVHILSSLLSHRSVSVCNRPDYASNLLLMECWATACTGTRHMRQIQSRLCQSTEAATFCRFSHWTRLVCSDSLQKMTDGL